MDGHKAVAAVVRDPETGRLELRPAQGFAKATGACVYVVVWYGMVCHADHQSTSRVL